MKTYIIKSIIIILTFGIAACGSLRTFHDYARAGDSVAVPVGMQPNFSKDNITVTITPASGPLIVLPATDPTIRGIVNLYPDPISSMNISRETSQDLTPFAQSYADTIGISTGDDRDFFQTTVFVDLPTSLPIGLTQIEVSNGLGDSYNATLNIVPGTGSANPYLSDFFSGLALNANMLDSMSRVSHQTVSFGVVDMPYAIELTITHDPDLTVGGAGKTMVVNPLGYKKNLMWEDDGSNLTVILMPSRNGSIDHVNDFKFYIAGGITNLNVSGVQGYDVNGGTVAGVSAYIAVSN